jgi:hypothetical protein
VTTREFKKPLKVPDKDTRQSGYGISYHHTLKYAKFLPNFFILSMPQSIVLQ